MSKAQDAAKIAIDIANDPAHGYAQDRRWGPDYDCSSLPIDAYEKAGVPLRSAGASYTGDIYDAALRVGFADVTAKVDLRTGEGLQPGDLVVNRAHHMVMSLGGGRIVYASINELGTVTGGQPGDQTGREILVGNYYVPNYGWDFVLRYVSDAGDPDEDPTEEPEKPVPTTQELPVLRRGMMHSRSVEAMQTLLIHMHGIDCGPDGADGDFGENTERAVIAFQETCGIEADGICGPVTWGYLLGVS